MKQITSNIRKQNHPTELVESDAKNAISTDSTNWSDFAGLSWIFQGDFRDDFA